MPPVENSTNLSSSIQTVKPEWIDYNGHMNVSYYTMAFDKALDEFLKRNFGMNEEYIARNRQGPFALQSNYVYLAELRSGEEYDVSTRILDYDHKRIHLFSSMWKIQDRILSATCESLSIFVDHQTRKSTPYPVDIYQKIKVIHQSTRNEPIPAQVNQTIGIRRN
jgi:acyl-CoA thioester hydrolase